jgi:hypothetical protein
MRGLILDGLITVGSFSDAENNDGAVTLHTVSINYEYINILKHKTKKQLRFIEAYIKDDSHVVANDYGNGFLSGVGMWIDTKNIVFVSAKIIKEDKNAN